MLQNKSYVVYGKWLGLNSKGNSFAVWFLTSLNMKIDVQFCLEKSSRGWLDCCTPGKHSAGRVGRLHQRSGRISGGLWIPFVGRCYLKTLVTSTSSRGCAGSYQPICQSTKKGQNTTAIILTGQVQSRPQAKASYSHGWKFNHMISREYVVQLLFLDFAVFFNIRYNSFAFSRPCFWVHIKPQFKYMWKQKYQNNGAEQSYRDSQDSLLKKPHFEFVFISVSQQFK